MKSVTSCFGKKVWQRQRNQTTTTLYKPKFCSKKCDAESVTLCVQLTTFTTIYEKKFCSKKWYTENVTFRGQQTDQNLHNCILIEILHKKVQRRKCEPFDPIGTANLHNYVLKLKFCSKKCDLESVTFCVQLTDLTFTTIN